MFAATMTRPCTAFILIITTITTSTIVGNASILSIRQSKSDLTRSRHLAVVVTDPSDSTNGTAMIPTNTTNATLNPATPSPSPSLEPTKRYFPTPDDSENERKEEDDQGGETFFKIILVLFGVGLIWMCYYYKGPIIFFLGTVWNNTTRHGCKGCLQTVFPCFYGSHAGGYNTHGGESLDQIIFETEDDGLRRGLLN